MDATNARDALRRVEDIALHARTEPVPDVEVTQAVLWRLRSERRPADRGLAILTAGALVAAIAITLLTFSDFVGALDPLEMMMATTVSSLI